MKKLKTEKNAMNVLALKKPKNLVLFLNIYLHNKVSFFFSLLLLFFVNYNSLCALIHSVILSFSIYCASTHAKDNITQDILKARLHDKTSSYKTSSNIIEHEFDNVQTYMFDRVDHFIIQS